MSLVVVAVDSRFLDGPVHPLDLTVGPRMVGLGQAVLDAVGSADLVEAVHAVAGGPAVAISGQVGELNAVVGQDGVQAVGHGRDQSVQEACGARPVGLLMQLGEGELGGPIDRDEQVELARFGADLGNVDVEIADRIGLELALVRLVALYLRQARDAVPLQTSVERRAGQVRDRRLQRIEAIIERQQRMAAERENDRLLLDRQNG